MVILVFSCDNNKDLWFPFYHCMEKYWKGHPKVIYKTEKLNNPYYDTIKKNYPLNEWTKGIRETLDEINDDFILFMADDMFIRRPVDIERVYESYNILKNNKHIANINYEKSWWYKDKDSKYKGYKLRPHGSPYEVSLMCGLWRKNSLKKVLTQDTNPWEIELRNNCYGYDYLTNSGEFIIDWGYTYPNYAGIQKGKWCKEAKYFFDNEGVNIDYEKRGFVNNNTIL